MHTERLHFLASKHPKFCAGQSVSFGTKYFKGTRLQQLPLEAHPYLQRTLIGDDGDEDLCFSCWFFT